MKRRHSARYGTESTAMLFTILTIVLSLGTISAHAITEAKLEVQAPAQNSTKPNLMSTAQASQAFADVFAIDQQAFDTHIGQVADRATASFLREYMALMQYTAANTEENYDAYMKASDRAMSDASKSAYEANLLCQLHIHKAAVYLYSGSLFNGGIQFWKAYNQFKTGEKRYPEYEGQLPLRGMFNILLSQVPEKWKTLAGLLGLSDGDLDAGFAQIEQHRKNAMATPGLRDEALLFSFTNMFFSHDQKLTAELKQLLRANENPVIRYAYVLSCGRAQRGEEAIEALAATSKTAMQRFPLFYHQLGKYALRQLKLDETIEWSRKFLNIYRGKSNTNNAYLQMAYAYILKGNRAEAQKMIDKCQKESTDFDIDRRTHEEAALAMDIDVNMLKARLQFEFGNFAQSLDMLKGFNPKTKDLPEYYFRMGRAYDKLGQKIEAKRWYDKAIESSAKSTRYFGPYAAVHAADICLEARQNADALKYVEKARKLNNGEYKKELDQRIELTERKAKGIRVE